MKVIEIEYERVHIFMSIIRLVRRGKMDEKMVQKIVKEAYSKVAQGEENCTCGTCGSNSNEFAKALGYSQEELKIIPDESNLGLGCGNPIALSNLEAKEVVLDLGSGAGFDAFLAANKVGAEGKVIGIDMTPEMIEKAEENARKNEINNVEFKLGQIEDLP